jgi:hypothetical protein
MHDNNYYMFKKLEADVYRGLFRPQPPSDWHLCVRVAVKWRGNVSDLRDTCSDLRSLFPETQTMSDRRLRQKALAALRSDPRIREVREGIWVLLNPDDPVESALLG